MKNIELSIVIPLFNEVDNIPQLFKELNRTLKTINLATEVILVDDGSTDNTTQVAKESKLNSSKKILVLSRNFGHQSAIYAGLIESKGKIIVTMDGDLQHPPSLIPKFIKLHKKGNEIVFTKRIDSQNNLKSLASRAYYLIVNKITNYAVPPSSSDFRSMTRKSLNTLLSLPENRLFLRGLVYWLGFKSETIDYVPSDRYAGKSKYSIRKMFQLGLHGITSFSTLPLFMAFYLSIAFFVAASAYAIYVLYIRFILNLAVDGWASVLFVLLVIGGLTSLFLGLIGLYLSAIYEEIKKRPQFILNKKL